ncbi:serine/threonine-protein kinase VRK1 [Copidosoma floridanum]|uniref:serine/threonine-protein kinase VRK1 n=1 Tax=Copidosoma floridanum TaxID=29053 RepID=UPI0006C99011|nr:serine/threonine-protein kinase VRK1 [Copidosoma floridanum]XP_014218472.1 serine/threonine-protein kinase VRK1 [Copidosoma floridanum]
MSKAVAKKAAPRKKGANGYKLPDPIPKGTVLTDLKKQQWIIGSSIGVGGFGEIYSASPYSGKTPSDYSAVVKIEPHGNGPLFVEMHFYMRNASPNDINNWKKEKKLSCFGMPPFLGSGSHELHNTKYRFVVMERYGTDLWKLFLENGRRFPEPTVYKVSWQIINVLEYIHHRTYVHADIKGANLLLDLKSQNQVYLVDFGLASHYTTKDYKLDPKKAHNGTIEYTSRDAHMGVPTMRGDFEILLYNMIQWQCSTLPWEKNLSDPSWVQQQKESALKNHQKFLKDCFSNAEIPETISQFTALLVSMKYNDTPNYDKFREILVKGLKKFNQSPTDKLDFSSKKSLEKSVATPKKTPRSKKIIPAEEEASPQKRAKPTPVKTSSKPKRNKLLLDDTLNNSIDSVILDEKCMTGKDIRKQLLKNIDGDAEYEIQIKKRKTRGSATDTPRKKAAKRVPKKVEKSVNTSCTDSEPEVVIKGTKSRPVKTAVAQKKNGVQKRPSGKKTEYDSEKDMFDESLDN